MQKKFVQLRLTDLAYTLKTQRDNSTFMYHYQMSLVPRQYMHGKPTILAFRLPMDGDPMDDGLGWAHAVLVWEWETSRWGAISTHKTVEGLRKEWRNTSKSYGYEEIHGSEIIPLLEIECCSAEPVIPEYTSEYALNA